MGNSLLVCAVCNGQIEMAKALIKANANVNFHNNSKCRPLHFASTIEIANALIKAGADVNAKDE